MPRPLPKIKRISSGLVVLGLPLADNQVKTKRVENALVPRLDEGSNPSASTHTKSHLMTGGPFFIIKIDYLYTLI